MQTLDSSTAGGDPILQMRTNVWGIAALIDQLNGLQSFARAVSDDSSETISIKRTAQILAYAQSELQKVKCNAQNHE